MNYRMAARALLIGVVFVSVTQPVWMSPAADERLDEGTVTVGSTTVSEPASLTTACLDARTRFFEGFFGVVTAEDGSEWTVPAEVTDGAVATDLFNDCTGSGYNAANYEAELTTVVIDPDGEEITVFVFADNYFELFINGEFVGKDAIPFVPFNTSVLRFRVNYPYTIAVKLVDWETHLGIGAEYDTYHAGDGGFIARFSDGTVTNADWSVQPVYIAPLDDAACVNIANHRDSSACSTQPACLSNSPDQTCQALHFAVPETWTAVDFDATSWDTASLYTAEQVTNQRGYTDYTDYFSGANFIWSRGLVLDNLVLARYTVESAPVSAP